MQNQSLTRERSDSSLHTDAGGERQGGYDIYRCTMVRDGGPGGGPEKWTTDLLPQRGASD